MKEKMTKFFQRMQPWFDRVGNNKYLQAVMGAMMATLGPMILGSIATMIAGYAIKWKILQLAKIKGLSNSLT